jgi:hypothetical protein
MVVVVPKSGQVVGETYSEELKSFVMTITF